MVNPDLEGLAALITYRIGGWEEFGYENPPTPECKPIPPLGERTPEAVKSGHAAIDAIDKLTERLDALRAQLVDELRQNEDALMARLDAKHGPLEKPERSS
jgi:hypothetical protein